MKENKSIMVFFVSKNPHNEEWKDSRMKMGTRKNYMKKRNNINKTTIKEMKGRQVSKKMVEANKKE